jgi:hypothetical protein
MRAPEITLAMWFDGILLLWSRLLRSPGTGLLARLGKARGYYLQAADTRANSLNFQTFPCIVDVKTMHALLMETLTRSKL